jgi:hypothetical protein
MRGGPATTSPETDAEHAIKLLDALSVPWTLVDVPWTPKQKNGVKADNDKPGDSRLNSEAL